MNRKLWFVLTMAVIGLMAAQVFARGGGGHHGGGHHGGGHHASHHHSNHHHSGHHHVAHHGGQHGWGGGGWGGGGWGAGWGGGWGRGWGYGSPWAAAGLGTAAAWMGTQALSPAIGTYAQPATVYTGSEEFANVEEPQQTPEETAQQAAQAADLVQNGATDPPQDEKLLPLGVYSLAPEGHTEATAMLQLALSKEGLLRGSYYDILSNHSHPVRGAVDRKTQRAAFRFGDKGKATFETTLANLTEETGPITVHYADGNLSKWTIARYQGEPGKEGEADDDNDSDEADDADESAETATTGANEAPAIPPAAPRAPN